MHKFFLSKDPNHFSPTIGAYLGVPLQMKINFTSVYLMCIIYAHYQVSGFET
jgi:hypothetical protein